MDRSGKRGAGMGAIANDKAGLAIIVRADHEKEMAHSLLATVIAKGGHDWAEICRKIDAHHCQLWFGVTDRPVSALVTQATTENALECLIAGGTDAKAWAGLAEQRFTLFARQNGLNRLRILGRKGWHRYFPHWEIVGKEDGLIVMEYAL